MVMKLRFSKLGSCVILDKEEFLEQNLNIFLSNEEPYDNHSDIAPELKLCAAILVKALADALNITSFSTEAKAIGRREEKQAADAREWLISESFEPFSFLWICEHLDIPNSKVDYLRAMTCGN